MDRYCLYLRKSREDAEAELQGEKETLARHEKILLDLAKRLHLEISMIYREIISGETIASRPMMQQLLAEVEKGNWTGVLVMEIERLARGDTIDQGIMAQAFKLSRTKIITPVKTYDPTNEFDEEYFEFGLFMSRREYKAINRRLQRGRLSSIQEGKYVASRPPYGYQKEKLENGKGFTLLPHPEESLIVQMIFELYTNGQINQDGTRTSLGLSLIARKLNALGVSSKSGKPWSPSTIRDMLTNPIYIGKVRWNWRPVKKQMKNGSIISTRPRSSSDDIILVPGLHKAIINEDLFFKTQEILAHKSHQPIDTRKEVQNPLCGLLICACCGRHLVRHVTGKYRKDILLCPNTSCPTVSVSLSLVEDRILAALTKWLSGYCLSFPEKEIPPLSSIGEVSSKAKQKLSCEIERLSSQLSHTYDLLEQGVYSSSEFHTRKYALEEKIKKIKSSLYQWKNEDNTEKSYQRRNLPHTITITDAYRMLLLPKDKNDFLKEILSKVIYAKETKNRGPDAFKLTIFPKLPRML